MKEEGIVRREVARVLVLGGGRADEDAKERYIPPVIYCISITLIVHIKVTSKLLREAESTRIISGLMQYETEMDLVRCGVEGQV